MTIGTEADWGDDSSRTNRLAVIAPEYVRTMGGGTYWSEIAPTRDGLRDWTKADRVIAANPNKRILWQFYKRPAWVTDADFSERLAEHMGEVFNRYDGKLWGCNLWNEPYWGGADNVRVPNCSDWSTMVDSLLAIYRRCAPVARQHNVKVVGPEWQTFYRQESERFIAGGGNLVDIWSWHDYSLDKFPDQSQDITYNEFGHVWPSIANRVAYYRKLTGSLPLAITEFGLPETLDVVSNTRMATAAAVQLAQAGVEFIIPHNAAAYNQPYAGFRAWEDTSMTAKLAAFVEATKAAQSEPPHACPAPPERVYVTAAFLDAIKGMGPTLVGRTKLALDAAHFTRPA